MSGSLVRKAVYLVLVAALLLPLALLSLPATGAVDGQPGSPGGILAQKRDTFRMSQANLGKIDPASETIRLATLGMRGVAANILWAKADACKVKEDWTGLSATLEQIAYLQPNYVSVWRYQGWNLSYNISAEWDDYRDRYWWVIKGIEFLERGIEYNENEPRLLTDVGWFASQKIGRSDEHLQYRRLFRDDDDFHSRQQVHERDNWLFGKEYFLAAERAVIDHGARVPTASPAIFLSRAPLAEINDAIALDDDYAEALNAAAAATALGPEGAREFERRLANVDRRFAVLIPAAWEHADREWHDLERREFPSTSTGEPLRLDQFAPTKTAIDERTRQLDALVPKGREEVRAEKLAKLPAAEREVVLMPARDRTKRQAELAEGLENKLDVLPKELAARAPPADKAKAKALAAQLDELEAKLGELRSARENVNFDYWQMRCRMERTDDARASRRLLHRAMTAFLVEGDLVTARADFEASFAAWRRVVDLHPELVTDQTAYLMLDATRAYRAVLKQMDLPFPKDFALQSIVDALESKGVP